MTCFCVTCLISKLYNILSCIHNLSVSREWFISLESIRMHIVSFHFLLFHFIFFILTSRCITKGELKVHPHRNLRFHCKLENLMIHCKLQSWLSLTAYDSVYVVPWHIMTFYGKCWYLSITRLKFPEWFWLFFLLLTFRLFFLL